MLNPRRTFIIHTAQTGCAIAGGLALSGAALAQKPATPELVKDTDANAIALGYKTDGSKTDTKKYPKYDKTQTCANCSLYQGKATDATAPCALFPGKVVANKAWCSAWVKKA